MNKMLAPQEVKTLGPTRRQLDNLTEGFRKDCELRKFSTARIYAQTALWRRSSSDSLSVPPAKGASLVTVVMPTTGDRMIVTRPVFTLLAVPDTCAVASFVRLAHTAAWIE